MAARKDTARIELATERVRERIARIELWSAKVQLDCLGEIRDGGLTGCVVLAVFLLRP
jgi:hypothetical protein